jgi:hypothetical protein
MLLELTAATLLTATPGDAPLANLTPEQLRVEYRRLDDARPSLAPHIFLFSAGGALMYVGLFAALWAALEGVQLNFDLCITDACSSPAPPPPSPPDYRLYAVAASLVASGLTAMFIAIWRQADIREERRISGERMDAIEASLTSRGEPLSRPEDDAGDYGEARARRSWDQRARRDPGMSPR